MLKSHLAKSPFHGSIPHIDTAQRMGSEQLPKGARFIEKLQVKPSEQRRIPLGGFANEETLRGFVVEVNPDPVPAKSVATKVTRLTSNGGYTLYLHIANHGKKVVQLEVWQL